MLESKTFQVWFGAAFLICAVSYCQALSAQEAKHSIAQPVGTYRIGVGDRIQVDIWQHPELTNTVVVDAKGDITLSSVGEVKVSGLSVTDVARLVRYKLERKIHNPQVTIAVVRVSNRLAPLSQPLRPPLPQHRDSPSPELRQDCCVAQNEALQTQSPN